MYVFATTSDASGRRWLLALLVLVLCGVGLATSARAQRAVPALTGRVVDLADVLPPSTERALTTMLADHEDATSNQVAVLTIPSLDGEAIEDYSIRVAETWALGTAANDNGVLLLVATADRELRIEVGLGLEGDLTDALASRIIRNDIVPLFRQGQYDTGVLVGVQSILGVIEGTYTPSESSSASPAFDGPPLIFRLVFGLLFILMPLLFFVPSFLIAGQWGNLGFMGLFIVVGGFVCFFSLIGGVLTAVAYVVLLLAVDALFRRQENWSGMRRRVDEALKENEGRRVKVTIGGFTFKVGGITSNSGSSSSSGWSSGSSSGSSSSAGGFSSSGSSSSAGGFSGGGGSFGGGGSSGSW